MEKKNEIESLYKISQILDCGLDQQTVSILIDLIEMGIDPESLADVIIELKSTKISSNYNQNNHYNNTQNNETIKK